MVLSLKSIFIFGPGCFGVPYFAFQACRRRLKGKIPSPAHPAARHQEECYGAFIMNSSVKACFGEGLRLWRRKLPFTKMRNDNEHYLIFCIQ